MGLTGLGHQEAERWLAEKKWRHVLARQKDLHRYQQGGAALTVLYRIKEQVEYFCVRLYSV